MSREKCNYCGRGFGSVNVPYKSYGGGMLHEICYVRVTMPKADQYVRTTTRLKNTIRWDIRVKISKLKKELRELEIIIKSDDDLIEQGLQSKTVRVMTGEIVETIPYGETRT